MKKILYVDMDNVLVDFSSGIAKLDTATRSKYEPHFDDVPGIFALMKPVTRATTEAEQSLVERNEILLHLSTRKNIFRIKDCESPKIAAAPQADQHRESDLVICGASKGFPTEKMKSLIDPNSSLGIRRLSFSPNPRFRCVHNFGARPRFADPAR